MLVARETAASTFAVLTVRLAARMRSGLGARPVSVADRPAGADFPVVGSRSAPAGPATAGACAALPPPLTADALLPPFTAALPGADDAVGVLDEQPVTSRQAPAVRTPAQVASLPRQAGAEVRKLTGAVMPIGRRCRR